MITKPACFSLTIAPPIGYGVDILPDNAEIITYNQQTYYYFNGTFYQKENDKYVITTPPIGSIVSNLPTDAKEVTLNSLVYYYYNGTYYQPISENNMPAYQVIENTL